MSTKLIKHTSIYTLSAILPQMANLFLMPVYTRYLDLAEFGAIAIVTSFAAFVGPFMGLQLNESFRRFYFDFDAVQARRYYTTVLLFMLTCSVLVAGLLIWSSSWWWEALSGVTSLPLHPYLEYGVVISILSSQVTLGINALVVEERSTAMLALSILRTGFGVLLTVALVVFLGMGAPGFLLAQAGTLFGTWIIGMWLNRHLLTFKANCDSLRDGLKYSLPLLPHTLSNALIGYADRIILGQFVSLDHIGLYDFADRIAKVFYQVVFAGDRAMTPVFMRMATEGKKIIGFFKTYVARWVVLYGLLFIFTGLLTRHFLILFIDEAYHASYAFIPILCGAYWLRGYYLFGVKQLMFAKHTQTLPVITVLSGGVNIAGNILLIPLYGVSMAAWTTVLSAIVAFVLARYWGQRSYPISYNEKQTWPMMAASLIIVALGAKFSFSVVWVDLAVKSIVAMGVAAVLFLTNTAGCRDRFSNIVGIKQ